MSFTHALLLLCVLLEVHGKFPNCQLQWELDRAEDECKKLQPQTSADAGCSSHWDLVLCWPSVEVGRVVTLPCPSVLQVLFGSKGIINRNCTDSGWSDPYPAVIDTCSSNNTADPSELVFYRVVKILATLGHSLSLITLLSSTFIICFFRRLHCMRNYIHLNLFVSFMLRAVAVLVKDALLFSDDQTTDCSSPPSLVGCKASLVFFHYFIMANFFWLLVEGLYLHTLLLVIHTYTPRLSTYMLISWGIPFVFMVAWIICRIHLEDVGCWDIDGNPVLKRLIDWPIMASVIVNFILFISIIRILLQKLRCTDVGGNEQSQYRRLAKSTLLLIPLFGVHYVVLVYLMEPPDKSMHQIKIFFELALGSYQGLIVAVLYCFLNSEVQSELKRTWRSFSLKRYMRRDCRLNAASISRNGTDNSFQFPRNCRAQSILQTETTML